MSIKIRVCILLSASFLSTAYILCQNIKVTSLDGGSLTLLLDSDIKLNENSSLHRTWLVFNDPICPVQLKDVGIRPISQTNGDDYSFVPQGMFYATDSISAIEIKFLLYNVFGEHIRTLSATHVRDIKPKVLIEIWKMGTWSTHENEVKGFLTSIAFVAQIRTSSGRIWSFNEKSIVNEVMKTQLKILSGDLSPKNDVPKKQ